MSETTPNLGLFKYNPTTDGKETFSIQAALNDNWDIIDEKCSRGSGFNLFDTKISDHVLEGDSVVGWALQGTYVNGAVYSDFYAKCLEEYNEATETETVNDVTVKVNSNGHKFYDITDKVSIDEFYNLLGSAWFYGVDTEQERIFLPRDNYFAIKGSVSTAPVVGNGMTLGLTNGASNFGLSSMTTGNGYALTNNSALYGKPVNNTSNGGGSTGCFGLTTDGTKSGIVADTSKVVQPNTDKYLYICVGNTIVNEGQIDASKVLSEAVLRSSLEQVHVVVETYQNGTSWYRIYSDGWCEQGGTIPPKSGTTMSYLKQFISTNHQMILTPHGNTSNNVTYAYLGYNKTISGFTIPTNSVPIDWYACGYIW